MDSQQPAPRIITSRRAMLTGMLYLSGSLFLSAYHNRRVIDDDYIATYKAHQALKSTERQFYQQDTALRALTLNIWGLPHTPDRKKRIKHIIDVVPTLDLDILALQECWMPADRRILRTGIAEGGLPYVAHQRVGLVGSGLMLFSRYPILEMDLYTYKLNGDPATWDWYANKGVLYARLHTPAGALDVYNTHAIAQHVPDMQDRYMPHRAAQMYEFTQIVNRQSVETPVLALGDFNVRPDQIGYRILTQLGALTDTYATLNPDSAGYTYSSDNSYNVGEPTYRIDYTFLRGIPHLQLTSIESTVVLQEIPGESTPYSDHYGVLTEFEMADRSSLDESATDSSTKESVLRELLATLNEGLAGAKSRSTLNSIVGGVGLLGGMGGAVGVKRASTTDIIRLPLTFLSGVAGGFGVVHSLRAAITAPREIQGFEDIIAEASKELQQL